MNELPKMLILISLVCLFFGCTDDNVTPSPDISNTEFPNSIYTKNATVGGLKLPDGTLATQKSPSTVEFDLPEGYVGVYKSKGKYLKTSRFEYTCSCSRQGGGCTVIYVNDKYGCLDDTCQATCSGSSSGIIVIIDITDPISFIDLDQDLKRINELPDITEEILDIPFVQDELANFAESIYGENHKKVTAKVGSLTKINKESDEFLPVTINLFGHKAEFILSKYDVVESQKAFVDSNATPRSHTCICYEGNGCKKIIAQGIRYCRAFQCSKCSMTVNQMNHFDI